MQEFERIYFEHVYARYADTLYRVAYCYVKNAAEAEDAVADTFCKLFQVKKSFESPEHEKAWLIRVCVNLSKNRLRSYWSRNVVPLSETYAAEDPEIAEIGDCLSRLPKRQTAAVYLYYYEGYSVREIAGMLARTESGVRTLLKRAREKLKTILEDEVQ